MRNLILTLFFFFWVNSFSFAQSKETLHKIEEANLTCYEYGFDILKSDEYVLKCQQIYLNKLDSLLTVVYENYETTLSKKAKIALRKDQEEWLLDKKKYFNETKEEFLSEPVPEPIDYTIAIDHYADFVTKRIEFLMDLLTTKSSFPF